jgi:DNA polymerase V
MATGFASPADDYLEGKLSLDTLLVQNKEATFFARAKGDSMVGAGISDNDLLLVDKSLAPVTGNIIIAVVEGELLVRRFIHRDGFALLQSENPNYPEIGIKDDQELQIWGVVTAVIKKFI